MTETDDLINNARLAAAICGLGSGAAMAVQRYEQLRDAGYKTRMLKSKNCWLVEEPHDPINGVFGMRTAFRMDE